MRRYKPDKTDRACEAYSHCSGNGNVSLILDGFTPRLSADSSFDESILMLFDKNMLTVIMKIIAPRRSGKFSQVIFPMDPTPHLYISSMVSSEAVNFNIWMYNPTH